MNVAVKDEDEVKIILSTSNHSDLLFFTNTGRVFSLPAYEVQKLRELPGQPIINLLSLQKEEIAAILDLAAVQGKHFALISKKAVIKRLDRKMFKISELVSLL